MNRTVRGLLVWLGAGLAVFSFVSRSFLSLPGYINDGLMFGGLILIGLVVLTQRPAVTSSPTPAQNRRMLFILLGSLVGGCVISFFILRREMPQLSGRTALFSAAITLFIGLLAIWWRFRRPELAQKFLATKRTWLIAVVVICAGAGVWFGYLDRDADECRRIDREIAAATDEFNRSPIGEERGVAFVGRLRTIDAHRAPVPVREALTEYILAFDQTLAKFRLTGEFKGSGEIEVKKAVLIEAIKRCKE